MRLFRPLGLFFILSATLPVLPAQPELAKGSELTSPAALQQLAKRWRSLREPGPKTGSRDYIGYALEGAAAGAPAETIEQALGQVRAMQDLTPSSKTFGNLQWYWGKKDIADPNAVEFCVQQGLVLRLLHSGSLSPKAAALLEEFLVSGIEGIHRHRVRVSYTNIFLMKAWNCIGLGRALGRRDLSEEGARMLEEWLRFTARCGITEYSSPNYYGVDLCSLALIAHEAEDPQVRAMAELALAYFWTEITANFFAPAQRLGGANSRCYQYLPGRGDLDRQFAQMGWQKSAPPTGAFAQATRWMPPESLTGPFLKTFPRTIVQHWGEEPWRIATHYLTEDFSLGSAGCNNNSDDRALVLIPGGGLETPEILLFMDGRGDPYGTQKTPDRSEHMKSLHLTPFVATVQRGPELIQVLSEDLSQKGQRRPQDAFSGLWTQLPLPATSRVFCEGRELLPGTPQEPTSLPTGAPIFVRQGKVCIGLRFLCATNNEGGTASLHLIRDDPKGAAMRLSLEHARDTAKGKGTTALWLRVASGLDEAGEAAFRKAFAEAPAKVMLEGGQLVIEAAGLQEPLRLEVNLTRGERIRLEGGEPDASTALLRVNGRDLGRDLLARYLSAPAPLK